MFLLLSALFSFAAFQQSWAAPAPSSIYDVSVTDIDGKPSSLAQYKGKVLVVVNTASRCGYTPQYKDLEALYEKYQSEGLVVLGCASNDFNQEPGDDHQIKKFCDASFKIKFPLFDKGHVKGSDRQPLYDFLTAPKKPGQEREEVSWNFEKFIVNRSGQVVARFKSGTKPSDSEFIQEVEKDLE